MKLSFTNLGILDQAEFELGDLTIICGKNNTGKTYATYATYGFLKSWKRFAQLFVEEKQLEQLTSSGVLEIDLVASVVNRWPEIQEKMAEIYKRILPTVLASDAERFKDTTIKIDIPLSERRLSVGYEQIVRLKGDKPILNFNKPINSSVLKITYFKDRQELLHTFALQELIGSAIQDAVLGENFSRVFMASTERTGATIFKNELNFTRTRLIEAITTAQHENKKIGPNDVLNAIFPDFNPRYGFAVRDEVEFANQLDTIDSEESELLKTHPDILNHFRELIGGEYKVSKKVVYFVPSGTRVKLGLSESSSAVRSLLNVDFYLRHKAKIGDIFMIDEPELNLHPANQRLMARLIARLVNAGLRVFITTHSDYIAKEVNTLLLLKKAGQDYAKHFGYDNEELLGPNQIRLYVACTEKMTKPGGARATNQHTLTKIEPLSDGGFDWPSFDDTIEEMDKIQRKTWEHIAEINKE